MMALGILIGLVAGIGIGLVVADVSRWLQRHLTRSELDYHTDNTTQENRNV